MENQKLKTVLHINGAFSLITGILMMTIPGIIAQAFNIQNPTIFYFIGAGLIGFALQVFFVAFRKTNNKTQVKIISFADFGWVAGSIIILVLQAFELSILAYITIASVALIVLLFGLFQLKFSR